MEPFIRKNTFFGAMSHEIRSTLAAVTGFHNLLLETSLNPEQHGFVENARTSTETLLTLVNDLVDFSLLEAGEFKLTHLEFDLRTAVEDAIETIAPRAFEMGGEVHTLIHASVPEIVGGDPTRLRRIIINLAGTALDFSTSPGEVVLSVRTVEESAGQVVVRFDITGFGKNLTQEQVQKLFKPLGSQDAASSLEYGRTGLELALSKRLIQTMGGQIGFSSVTGRGATFWFTIELSRCKATLHTTNTAVTSIEGMNVLVADPSTTGRRVIVHYLESMGVCCREFENAGDMLSEIAAANKSGIICDAMIIALQQVGGTGFEIAARIRNVDPMKSIPLILVTAIGSRGDAVRMKEIGVEAYLTRPLKQYQLGECMRMIRRRSIETTTPANTAERPLITRHTIAEAKSGCRFRVLVADDNPANRRTIRRYLDNAGYICEVAENGTDAIASFERKTYDFVFLDCEMPVMNGFESATFIRNVELERTSSVRVPLCGMVASLPGVERARCIAAGMDDCITKPFDRADCIAMVEKWRRKGTVAENSIT